MAKWNSSAHGFKYRDDWVSNGPEGNWEKPPDGEDIGAFIKNREAGQEWACFVSGGISRFINTRSLKPVKWYR